MDYISFFPNRLKKNSLPRVLPIVAVSILCMTKFNPPPLMNYIVLDYNLLNKTRGGAA